MKMCWSLRETCCTSRNYVKDGTNSHVISQDSFIVIHNTAESAKYAVFRQEFGISFYSAFSVL